MRELAISWSLRGWIEAFENGHLVVAQDKQEWWEQRCIEQRELLGLPAIASQPPQELVSLVAKWRERANADEYKLHREWAIDQCADELEAALTRGAVGG